MIEQLMHEEQLKLESSTRALAQLQHEEQVILESNARILTHLKREKQVMIIPTTESKMCGLMPLLNQEIAQYLLAPDLLNYYIACMDDKFELQIYLDHKILNRLIQGSLVVRNYNLAFKSSLVVDEIPPNIPITMKLIQRYFHAVHCMYSCKKCRTISNLSVQLPCIITTNYSDTCITSTPFVISYWTNAEGIGSIQAGGTLCKCNSCSEKYCVTCNDYRNFSICEECSFFACHRDNYCHENAQISYCASCNKTFCFGCYEWDFTCESCHSPICNECHEDIDQALPRCRLCPYPRSLCSQCQDSLRTCCHCDQTFCTSYDSNHHRNIKKSCCVCKKSVCIDCCANIITTDDWSCCINCDTSICYSCMDANPGKCTIRCDICSSNTCFSCMNSVNRFLNPENNLVTSQCTQCRVTTCSQCIAKDFKLTTIPCSSCSSVMCCIGCISNDKCMRTCPRCKEWFCTTCASSHMSHINTCKSEKWAKYNGCQR